MARWKLWHRKIGKEKIFAPSRKEADLSKEGEGVVNMEDGPEEGPVSDKEIRKEEEVGFVSLRSGSAYGCFEGVGVCMH